MIIYHQLRSDVNCHECKDKKLLLSLDKNLPKDFTSKVITYLNNFTNQKWVVEILDTPINKAETLDAKEMYDVQNHAVVKEILKDFPGTKIKNINELAHN